MSVSLVENGTLAYQASASDPDGQALSYSIAGGADSALFSITSGGALSMAISPNFDRPQDSNGNNSYLVNLRVSDGSLTDTLNLTVNVTNSKEGISVRRVVSGLNQPIDISAIPGDDMLLVATKTGPVYELNPANGATTQILSVSSIGTAGEGGVLGLAPAADYGSTGRLYVFATSADRTIEIRQYLGVGQGAPPTAYDVLLSIPHPTYDNHFGGWMAIGPDGHLYVGTGDGGGAGDPGNNAQDTSSRLGKILRIDVSTTTPYASPAAGNPFIGGAGDDYIFALGLRNPFRNGFFGTTLIIGDVGQDAREEIDALSIASGAGANFGWPFKEGTLDYRGGGPAGLVAPRTEYGQGSGPYQGASVIGGYVYDGPIASLQDFYIFGDYISDNIWAMRRTTLLGGGTVAITQAENKNADFAPNAGSINQLVGFGLDNDGNLWIVDIDGEIFIVEPA